MVTLDKGLLPTNSYGLFSRDDIRPIANKFGKTVINGDGRSPVKSYDPFLARSCDVT